MKYNYKYQYQILLVYITRISLEISLEILHGNYNELKIL